MSIRSHAFGRVTLTGQDAKKFRDQVRYGRPKPAAVASVKRGMKLSRSLVKKGSVKFTLRASSSKKR